MDAQFFILHIYSNFDPKSASFLLKYKSFREQN